MHTRNPRAAAAIAVARPMPRLPPVMITTLSVKSAPTKCTMATAPTSRLRGLRYRPGCREIGIFDGFARRTKPELPRFRVVECLQNRWQRHGLPCPLALADNFETLVLAHADKATIVLSLRRYRLSVRRQIGKAGHDQQSDKTLRFL